MSKNADLTGRRFGKLTVVEKTGEQEDRYWTWRCRCDCGEEIIVNTKRLTRGTISHCGCEKKNAVPIGPIPEDLSGKKYGRLTVLKLIKQRENGKSSWLCQCDCGNQCVVTAYALHYKKRKSCGCLHRELNQSQTNDLTDQTFGKLIVLESTNVRDKKGALVWRCRCACGTEVNVSQTSLELGAYTSCGCGLMERQESMHENLTYVENTCVEILEYRKSRSDNTSGFRGVSRGPEDKWLVTIGLQGKRYYVGLYADFDDAVKARLHIEEALHGGFLEAYQTWQGRAEEDKAWAKKNPFYFNVQKSGRMFYIDSTFGSTTVSPLKVKSKRKTYIRV